MFWISQFNREFAHSDPSWSNCRSQLNRFCPPETLVCSGPVQISLLFFVLSEEKNLIILVWATIKKKHLQLGYLHCGCSHMFKSKTFCLLERLQVPCVCLSSLKSFYTAFIDVAFFSFNLHWFGEILEGGKGKKTFLVSLLLK